MVRLKDFLSFIDRQNFPTTSRGILIDHTRFGFPVHV